MNKNWSAYFGILALAGFAGVTVVVSHHVAGLAIDGLRAAMM